MLEVFKKRHSIRKYQPKEVEEEKLNEILKAAMFAPSANNRRPWEFIIIKNSEIKEKLSLATVYSGFIKEAPIVIIPCVNEADEPRWVEDLSIIASHIYLEATNQGLGTCFVQIKDAETPDNSEAEEYVRKIIGVPREVRIICLMPVGYPAEEKEEHTELEFEKEKIHLERWNK